MCAVEREGVGDFALGFAYPDFGFGISVNGVQDPKAFAAADAALDGCHAGGEAENVGDFVEGGFVNEAAAIGDDLVGWSFASAVPSGSICEEAYQVLFNVIARRCPNSHSSGMEFIFSSSKMITGTELEKASANRVTHLLIG